MSSLEPVGWRLREPPLEPVALVARGDVVASLLKSLRRRQASDAGRLRALGFEDGESRRLVVIGSADDLPWVESLLYLGRDPDAPLLLLPTRCVFGRAC